MAYDFQHLNPYEMIADVPNWILNQWQAWYALHNLVGNTLDPEFRADVRAAKGFTILTNHWREKSALGIEDLLPFPPEKPKQTPEQLRAALSARADRSKRIADRKAERESKSNGVTGSQSDNQTQSRRRRSQQGIQRDQGSGDGSK